MNDFCKRGTAWVLVITLLLQSCYNPYLGRKELIPQPASNKSITIQEVEVYTESLLNPSLSTGRELQLNEPDRGNLALIQAIHPMVIERNDLQARGTAAFKTKKSPQPVVFNQPGTQHKPSQWLRAQNGALLPGQKRLSKRQKGAKHKLSISSSFQDLEKGTKEADQLTFTMPVTSNREESKKTDTKSFIAKGGHEVRFQQMLSGKWQAVVSEYLPAGISRSLILPVCLEQGYHIATLSEYSPAWQKSHIHIIQHPEKSCVFVGKMGLLGGMIQDQNDHDEEENISSSPNPNQTKIEGMSDPLRNYNYKNLQILTKSDGENNLSIGKDPLYTTGFPQENYQIDGKNFVRQNVSGRAMRCFFNAAGLDAVEQVNKLRLSQNDPVVRYMIANEIVSAAETPDQLSNKIKEAIKYTFYDSQRDLTSHLEEKRSQALRAQNPDANYQDPKALPDLLQNTREMDDQILEDLRERACSLQAFNIFIDDHIGGENMMVALHNVQGGDSGVNTHSNYTSIDAIAYINHFGIKIYQPTTNGGLRLVHQFISRNATRVVKLYHSNLHFQALLLYEGPSPTNPRRGIPKPDAEYKLESTINKEDLEYNETDKLGEGNFGIVYKGLLNKQTQVAIKRLQDRDNLKAILGEISIMKGLIHDNVVEFLGVCDNMIVTECMSGGSVEEYLKKSSKRDLTPIKIIDMALDAAKGVRYLHEIKMIHRDLAARNLLLTTDGKGRKITKVSDFGLSRQLSYEDDEYERTSNHPIKWSAPESFEPPIGQKQVTLQSDIWSYGVVLYELFTFCKYMPYVEAGIDVKSKLKKGKAMYKYLQIADCPEGVQGLLNECLNYNSAARPDFDDIVHKLKKVSKKVQQDNTTWKKMDDVHPSEAKDNGYSTVNEEETSKLSKDEEVVSVSVNEIKSGSDERTVTSSDSNKEEEKVQISNLWIGKRDNGEEAIFERQANGEWKEYNADGIRNKNKYFKEAIIDSAFVSLLRGKGRAALVLKKEGAYIEGKRFAVGEFQIVSNLWIGERDNGVKAIFEKQANGEWKEYNADGIEGKNRHFKDATIDSKTVTFIRGGGKEALVLKNGGAYLQDERFAIGKFQS